MAFKTKEDVKEMGIKFRKACKKVRKKMRKHGERINRNFTDYWNSGYKALKTTS